MSDILNTVGMLLLVYAVLFIPAVILFRFFTYLDKLSKSAQNSPKGKFLDDKIQLVFSKIEKVFPLPRPTEASLFVSSLAIILIALTYIDFWREVAYVGSGKHGGEMYLAIIYAFTGAFYSIYHAFSQREKTSGEYQAIRYFSILTLIGASFSSAVYIFNSKEFGFLFFSGLNFLHACKLLFLSGDKYLGDRIQLSNRQAERKEIFLGIIVVLLVFGVEKYIYDTHWSILFSSVLFFWSIVGSFFSRHPLDRNQ